MENFENLGIKPSSLLDERKVKSMRILYGSACVVDFIVLPNLSKV